MNKRKLGPALAFGVCSPLLANTGAPIFVLVSTYVFIFGFIIIVLLEALLINRWAKRSWSRAILDSFWANLASSAIGGVLLPFFISLIGFLSYAMPRGTETFFSYLGTMGYRHNPTPFWSLAFSVFWFAVTVVISTFVEAKILAKRWARDSHPTEISSMQLCWRAHGISYPIMLGLFWALRLRA